MRALKTEALLRGKKIDASLVEEASRLASEEACPITDVRATAEYRSEMVKVFTKYALEALTGEAG